MTLPDRATDARLLLLSAEDEILIVAESLRQGDAFFIEGSLVVAGHGIPLGYKVARRDLLAGSVVHRYGVPIGRLTSDVGTGEIVHTHNLASSYTRTRSRGEAD